MQTVIYTFMNSNTCAGDIVMFVNTRVLHGRTAYKVEESGQRHLETVYMDMEEVLSRRFLLQSLLNKD